MVYGTWLPSESLLGTYAELDIFSNTIRFYVPGATADPAAVPPVESGVDVYYKVRITAVDFIQSTVSYTYPIPLDPATISGYYSRCFNDTLTTRAINGTFTTITSDNGFGVFDSVNRNTLYEVISFKADVERSKIITYLAEAIDTVLSSPTYNQVVASKVYTIKVEDKNWTPGMLNLKELVSYASSK